VIGGLGGGLLGGGDQGADELPFFPPALGDVAGSDKRGAVGVFDLCGADGLVLFGS
jgi:hypothetical protein